MSDVLKMRSFDFAAPKNGACDVLVIAGEHSGDEQSARMIRSALEKNPSLRVCAFGGSALVREGAQLLFDMTAFSVVGLAEVVKNYSFFKSLSSAVVSWIDRYRPKAVCFVDYPGFNLHIAKILKKRKISLKGGGNVKLIFYISPQIWAWKASRRFKMAETLDSLAAIFPFEPKFYSDTALPVSFVGHPFLSDTFQPPARFDPNGDILLLAGSREIAVSRIFPVMVAVLKRLPSEHAVAVYPTPAIRAIIQSVLDRNPDVAPRVKLVGNNHPQISAKAVMMSSGTMSLACSLAGIPGAIVYKANPITYAVGRSLVKIKYLSIANIILDSPAWREFIQFDATPSKLLPYFSSCLSPSAPPIFAAYALKLRSLLSAPSKLSAADWLLSNLK